MDLHKLSSIPPKRLAMIAAGGIGLGLLWRHYSASRGSQTTAGGTDSAVVDTSQLALAQNSAGNLGAAQTVPLASPNDATRDLGSGYFPLPVTKGVIRGADGIDYYIDSTGVIIGPVYGPSGTTQVPAYLGPNPGDAGYVPGLNSVKPIPDSGSLTNAGGVAGRET